MKGCKEFKKRITAIRKHHAKRNPHKKNGALGFVDDLWLEQLYYNSKKFYQRNKVKLEINDEQKDNKL